MFSRRVVCGSLSLVLGSLALFGPAATGAIDTEPSSTRPAGVGVALVGVRAHGVEPASVMPLRHHDAETGRSSYAFTDDQGARLMPAD